jgi:hypothetical protein
VTGLVNDDGLVRRSFIHFGQQDGDLDGIAISLYYASSAGASYVAITRPLQSCHKDHKTVIKSIKFATEPRS